MRTILGATLAAVVLLATVFVADKVLLLAGFPEEVPVQIVHPTNFTENRRNIEFEYTFSTNRLGLRSEELSVNKPKGETRIIVLGDSFTEGFGVKQDETFVSLLQARIGASRSSKFINAGLSGQGPERYLRIFRGLAPKLELDGVLICLFANDLVDTPPGVSWDDLFDRPAPSRTGIGKWAHVFAPRIYTQLKIVRQRFTSPKHNDGYDLFEWGTTIARERGIPDAAIDAWKQRVSPDLASAAGRREFNGTILWAGLMHKEYWTDSLDITSDTAEERYASMKLNLLALLEEARTLKLDIGVVYIPTRFQYDPSSFALQNPWAQAGVTLHRRWLHEESELQHRIAELFDTEEVPFLDLTPALRAVMAFNPDIKLVYPLDGHFNATGHQFASEKISEWLVDKQIFGEHLGYKPKRAH